MPSWITLLCSLYCSPAKGGAPTLSRREAYMKGTLSLDPISHLRGRTELHPELTGPRSYAKVLLIYQR